MGPPFFAPLFCISITWGCPGAQPRDPSRGPSGGPQLHLGRLRETPSSNSVGPTTRPAGDSWIFKGLLWSLQTGR